MVVPKSTRKILLITLGLLILFSSVLLGCSGIKINPPQEAGSSEIYNAIHPSPSVSPAPSVVNKNKGLLEISFNFLRRGTASSQYAVWIEDTSGKLIKTLFVTSFTAGGGYTYRPESIPTWVSKANLSKLTSSEIDAISGPTPRLGKQVYSWDGTDSNGKAVLDGEYRFFLEASFYWSSEVLYSGTVNIGGKNINDIKMTPSYTSSDTTNRNMLGNVHARYYYSKK